MRWRPAIGVGVLLAGWTGGAAALTPGDKGFNWVAAPHARRIQVTNVLSYEVGAEPRDIQACLEKVFNTQDPQVLSQTIKDALKLCPDLKKK
jgi:hypothetical protein